MVASNTAEQIPPTVSEVKETAMIAALLLLARNLSAPDLKRLVDFIYSEDDEERKKITLRISKRGMKAIMNTFERIQAL